MVDSVVGSTLLLTLLLVVGLLFFIRASVKDRTQVVRLSSVQSDEWLLTQLKQYFADRAYQVTSIDADRNVVNLQGNVRPSLFLAIFLSSLALVGMICLVLVLEITVPALGLWWWLLLAIAPGSGFFYWKKANRPESVSFRLESDATPGLSVIKLQAHRDEVEALQETLGLELLTSD
jgi:Cofactor assembly of complex C subunit B